MKKKIAILMSFVFFILPTTIHASIFCGYEEKAYLKRLASNINVRYDYVEQDSKAIFKLTFSNIHKKLVIKDKNSNTVIWPDTSKDLSEAVLENYESGKTYSFDVYSVVADCDDEILTTIYVNLPSYNPYYKEEVCKGIESYKLCTKWNHHGLTKDRFIEEVKAYKESLNKRDDKPKEEQKEEKLPYLLELYLKYYYIVLPIIIFGFGFIVYQHNKKDRFF